MTADHAQPGSGLLRHVVTDDPAAFAVLHRPLTDPDHVDVIVGEVAEVARLADLPLPPTEATGSDELDLLCLVPYRQLAERDFRCPDDDAPLITMTVREHDRVPLSTTLATLPDSGLTISGAHFDIDDESYAETVRTVLDEEIGRGTGANFVIKRSFVAEVPGWGARQALTLFRRLLDGEQGAYWTFVVHTGSRTFVGATPERHISVTGGTAVMNPISGTLRYPREGVGLDDVMRFLADGKESAELLMVVDEELKMMGRICTEGGRIVGPFLREMAHLAHTEYLIEGRTECDVPEILRETLFAPTVTGSPIESACRVIDEYEPQGRGYYSGIAAMVGRDRRGRRTLDSAILLRTAQVHRDRLEVAVGATLVRDSEPASEVDETYAKSGSLLRALDGTPRGAAAAPAPAGSFAEHPEVRAALARRNSTLAPFWMRPARAASPREAGDGRRVLVVDAEDTFTWMLAHQMRALDLEVSVRRHDEDHDLTGHDLVVLGPGPGDPCDVDDPRMARMRALARELLAGRTPFLAVCLSHQILGGLLGFPVHRLRRPRQGHQCRVDLFGREAEVGFYNTFVVTSEADETRHPGVDGRIAVCREPSDGHVHALRGPHFSSFQFHPESVLSRHGTRVLSDELALLLPASRPAEASA